MYRYTNCITPQGAFVYGIHKPSYSVTNLRQGTNIKPLGLDDNGKEIFNTRNFPDDNISVSEGSWVYEIANPLPFRGTTYIDKNWADSSAADYSRMKLKKAEPLSFSSFLQTRKIAGSLLTALPRPLLLTLAVCSTDEADLRPLAEISCEFVKNGDGLVTGLRYRRTSNGGALPVIHDHDLFEAVANNPALPNAYKKAMVLRPGAQGASEITADWINDNESHIFEYLRRNSYIAGGHFAANMADDAMRYSINDLSESDMHGLRHLYYQRMYVHLGEKLGISISKQGRHSVDDLESLRHQILQKISKQPTSKLATLWGWNFGFDYSPTDYRLHASHQQIHQQYAVIPETVEGYQRGSTQALETLPSFCCGDLVAREIETYRREYHSELFHDYLRALAANVRMDERSDLPSSLVIWEDENVLLFVPKAQTSQWEVQIITKPKSDDTWPGNIVETDPNVRKSLDYALLRAQQALATLGAKMVTSIEFSARLGREKDVQQPLIYALLPKLPFSMGAFSEAQLRYINGHYPEDFAAACRFALDKLAV